MPGANEDPSRTAHRDSRPWGRKPNFRPPGWGGFRDAGRVGSLVNSRSGGPGSATMTVGASPWVGAGGCVVGGLNPAVTQSVAAKRNMPYNAAAQTEAEDAPGVDSPDARNAPFPELLRSHGANAGANAGARQQQQQLYVGGGYGYGYYAAPSCGAACWWSNNWWWLVILVLCVAAIIASACSDGRPQQRQEEEGRRSPHPNPYYRREATPAEGFGGSSAAV